MVNFFNDLVGFAGAVTENVSAAFREIANFIKAVQILGLNVYFVVLVLLFFLLLFGLVYFPVRFYPYYVRAKALFFRFFERFEKPKRGF